MFTSSAQFYTPTLPQPDFELNITDVSPDVLVERFPMTIGFTLKNNTQSTASGTVGASFVNQMYRVNNLESGATHVGSISGPVAANAGHGQTLQLSFYKDGDGEFTVTAMSYGLGYDIAGRYMFNLDSVRCHQIRSAGFVEAGRDNDFVFFTVQVGSQVYPVQEYRWKHIGLVFGPQQSNPSGVVPVNMSSGVMDIVPGYGTPVVIAYHVINHGDQFGDLDKFMTALNGAAQGALDAIYPGQKQGWQELHDFTSWLNAFLYGGQEGYCLADLIDRADESTPLTMDVLIQRTHPSGQYTETRTYPQVYISPQDWDAIYNQGFPGHVPQYDVTWSFIQVGPQ